MADFTLTTGADTVAGGAADDTAYATAATLNAGDSLTGGAGTDVLAVGRQRHLPRRPAGDLHRALRTSRSTTPQTQFAKLTLGSQPIEVDATGYLSVSGNLAVELERQQHHQRRCVAGVGHDESELFQQLGLPAAAGNLRSDLEYVFAYRQRLRQRRRPHPADQQRRYGGHPVLQWLWAERQVGDRRIDARPCPTRRWLGSRSPAPTAWARPSRSATWARHFRLPAVRAGHAHRQRLHLERRPAERDLRHQPRSRPLPIRVERMRAPPPSPGIVGLTTGNDTIVTPSSGSTVYATAATLNAGDSLTGGAGTDVLAVGRQRHVPASTSWRPSPGLRRSALDNATNSFCAAHAR